MTYRAPLAAFAAALLLAGCGSSSTAKTATTAPASTAPAASPTPHEEPSPVPGYSSKKAAEERLEAIKKQIEKRVKIVKPVNPPTTEK